MWTRVPSSHGLHGAEVHGGLSGMRAWHRPGQLHQQGGQDVEEPIQDHLVTDTSPDASLTLHFYSPMHPILIPHTVICMLFFALACNAYTAVTFAYCIVCYPWHVSSGTHSNYRSSTSECFSN